MIRHCGGTWELGVSALNFQSTPSALGIKEEGVFVFVLTTARKGLGQGLELLDYTSRWVFSGGEGGGEGRSLQGVGYFLSNSTRNYDLVAISSSASLLDKVQVLVCLDWKLYSAWPCVYTIATLSFDTH